MAATYITTADINTVIPASLRDELFSDDDVSDTILTRTIELASSIVKAAAHKAGYTSLGDSTANDEVKSATLGQFIALAYNRARVPVPAEFFEVVNKASDIASGQLPLTGLTPVARDAVGGVSFSETSSSVSGARYQVLSRKKLDVY